MFSIVLINFNGMHYLPRCLEAIRRQTYTRGWEIIVVNNRSTDGSLAYLQQQQDIQLIDPGGNSGFSRGQNLGILRSRGRYILCLNFDCLLEPTFLQEIAAVFEAKPEIGAVSGKLRKLVDGQPTQFLDSTGIAFHRCMPADRGEWKPDESSWDRPGPIFGPSGAAACYRRAALEDVRYKDEFFDEDFFIYCEDIDLAWRLNLAGWKSWYQPTAIGFHERGCTRKNSPWERRNYFVIGFRNRLLAMYKNLRWHEDLFPYWGRILMQETRFALGWARGGVKPAFIMLLAVTKFFGTVLWRRRLRRKRRQIQHTRRDADFSLGWISPPPESQVSAQVDAFRTSLQAGPTLFQATHIETRNLNPRKSLLNTPALAAGRSCKKDPQFLCPLPEEAANFGLDLLEFDLHSSQEVYGQIIWMGSCGYCVSASFRLHRGRHVYVVDLKELPLQNEVGNPMTRQKPVHLIRLDPTEENNVDFQLFAMRLCQRVAEPVAVEA